MGQSHYQSPCHHHGAPREYDAWEGEILSGLLEGDKQHIVCVDDKVGVTGDSGGRRSRNAMQWKR